MDKMRITIILILTCVIIIGTTCLAATGLVNAPSGLVLRKEASRNADPITTVEDSSKVEIIEKVGEWYKVKYGEYEGYLFAEYVNVEETIEEEQASEEENTENTENSGNEGNEQTEETQNNKTTYPQDIIVNTNIKGYLLPSIASRVILTIDQDKTITVNYELGNWLNITYDGKQAWIRKYFTNITEVQENNEENKEEVKEENNEEKKEETQPTETSVERRTGYVNVNSSANIRKSASTSADVVTSLLRNAEVTIIAESGDFYKIEYKDITGYISKSLISDTALEPTSRSNNGERKVNTETSDEESSTAEYIPAPSNPNGEAIASYAQQYVGYSYVYGGTTPSGFDCTGFAYYVFNQCGIPLSRSCSVQSRSGVAVSRDELEPGDLILFNNGGNGTIGHVGIYIGGGNIVHAENSRTGVVISTIESGYYNKYYYSARRIAE